MINHPNRSKNRDTFKDALGEEAYGVFGRTGFTPSQLAEYWKRDLGLYDEVLAQRAELIAALTEIEKWLANGDYDTRGGLIEMDRLASIARATIAKGEGR